MTTLSRSIRGAALSWPLRPYLGMVEEQLLYSVFLHVLERIEIDNMAVTWSHWISSVEGRTYMLLVAGALES